jgi:hypothetical protein
MSLVVLILAETHAKNLTPISMVLWCCHEGEQLAKETKCRSLSTIMTIAITKEQL